MLDLSNLSWIELEQLSDFFQTMGRIEESGIVLDILAEELEQASVEHSLRQDKLKSGE